MANFNISDLEAITALNDTDLYEVEQSGINRKVTGLQLKAYLAFTLPTDIVRHKGNCDLSTNLFPGGSAVKKYNRFYNIAASTTLTDAFGDLIPARVFVEANTDNPSTTDPTHWFIYYTI